MRDYPLPALRPIVLAVALAVTGIGACSGQTTATAQTPAAAATPMPPPPQLVAGLPDFTVLVDQVGPAVVSVQAEIGGGAPRAQRTRQDQQERRDSPNRQSVPDDGDDYGYCDKCGVEIGIKRLEARPTATLCIDCKTLDELKEKQMAK